MDTFVVQTPAKRGHKVEGEAGPLSSEATQSSILTTLNTINTKLGGFNIPTYDYIAYTSNTTSDVFVYKLGGSGGTTVATVTINYSDSSKTTLTNVTKV